MKSDGRGEDPTVFLVDDDAGTRDTVEKLMASVDLAVESYPSAEDFLTGFDSQKAGCLVLDVRLRGMSGLQLQESLVAEGVNLPIIIMTAFADVRMAIRALEHGAFKFIEKPCNPQDLLEAVHRAVNQSVEEARRRARLDEIQQRVDLLTAREREVMTLLTAGHPSKIIAAKLGLSKKTVDTNRQRVMAKMQAGSVAELVRMSVLLEDA